MRRPKAKALGIFKSKLEQTADGELLSHKADYLYESEKLPYVISRNYIPDFVLRKKNGDLLYLEVKGYLRPGDRTKMVAVKKAHPLADIRFVFAKNNKISGSKMYYSDWSNKYGFPFVFGKIPKKWTRE